MIGRCLERLTRDSRPDEVEIIVVCNGCSDNSAEIARAFGPPVRVLETSLPSKTNALNMGDAEAKGFPRIYLDSDVEIDMDSIRKVAAALERDGVFAAGPRPINVFDKGARWGVRAYYRFWTALPYIREGMIASGAYALNERGRARFDKFPDVIADDGYVRMLFDSTERALVVDATSIVHVPLTLGDLMHVKTRSRVGVLQLRRQFPQLARREASSKRYGRAFVQILTRPSLYLAAAPYLYVASLSWLRARRQLARPTAPVWARDDSSRGSSIASD